MEESLQFQIDELRKEVHQLAASLEMLSTEMQKHLSGISVEGQSPSRGQDSIWPVSEYTCSVNAKKLMDKAKEQGVEGLVSSLGIYRTNERAYSWDFAEITAETLIQQDDDKVARVLTAIGNKQRLAIMKAILRKPASATELVDRLGMGTTGQVYHHLKVLQAADLIAQEERGLFIFTAHRVPGFLTLLAGAQALLNTSYGTSTWEEATPDQT